MANGMEEVEKLKDELRKLKHDVIVGYNNILQTFSEIDSIVNKLNIIDREEETSKNFFKMKIDEIIMDIEEDEKKRRLSKLTKVKDTKTKCSIVGTDGSLHNYNSKSMAAYSVFFGYESNLNTANICQNNGTTLLPELKGMEQAIKTAIENGQKNLAIIADNSIAIDLADSIIRIGQEQCSKITNIRDKSPETFNTLEKIENLSEDLDNLIFVWQKSHVSVNNVYTEYNSGADKLAREHEAEISVLILKKD